MLNLKFIRSKVMPLRRLVALSFLAVSTTLAINTTAMADTLDINLRDSSAQVQYKSSMGRDALGKTEFHVGVLFAKQNNTLGDAGVLVKDEVGSSVPGFSVGVGIKGLAAHTMGTNESALALGGMMRYSPPDAHRLGVVGLVYFSPNITTFGDADRFSETGIRVEYEVIPQAAAYLGYRKIRFGLNAAPNVILDEGIHVGVRLSF
jgi:hypothetical protein